LSRVFAATVVHQVGFMLLRIVLGVVIGSLVITMFALKAFMRFRRTLELQLRQRLGDYQLRVSEYQKRLGLIDPYASDYMNSLSPDTARALIQLRRLMGTHQRLMGYLHTLLLSRDYEKFPEALVMLDKVLSRPTGTALQGGSGSPAENASSGSIDMGGEMIPSIPKNWEIQVEALLQQVGQDVFFASKKAKEIGLPRNRLRKPTIMSLTSAGILEAAVKNNSKPN
jgi:hypothetical protein